jgi:hypothetical protein
MRALYFRNFLRKGAIIIHMNIRFRTLTTWSGLLLASASWASTESWFGIYMNGGKIGYSRSAEFTNRGSVPFVSESETVLKTAMMGSDLDMRIVSSSEYDAKRALKRMVYTSESNGRRQSIVATLNAGKISVRMDNDGQIMTKSIDIPKGATVVDDGTSAADFTPGKTMPTRTVYVLDPVSVTLIPTTLKQLPPAEICEGTMCFQVFPIEVSDARAKTTVYFKRSGDLFRVDAPLGMTLKPESKADAMKGVGVDRPDLGDAARVKTNKPIEKAWDTLKITLGIEADLSMVKSDAYQTITKKEKGYELAIHPPIPPASGATIANASKLQTAWIKPSMHMPSDQVRFKDLAKKVIGAETDVFKATQKVSAYVDGLMRENGGIGVLRNANEIADTKEGVCRDFAILAATILRAGGVPTRLVSGLIYDDGAFWYHAWIEVSDGKGWYMFDPTRSNQPLNASRIKLREGQVEDVFTFPVIHGTIIQVLNVEYSKN